jgi:hypothetical protein
VLGKIIAYLGFAFLAYWIWTGPYQDWQTDSYSERLKENAKTMTRCLGAEDYLAGATGSSGTSDPEAACAQKYNLYKHREQWHSYDDVRPDD